MLYKKESLELLRQRIDLVEVLSPHLKLVRSGSSYKACCPFHEEKTPSFVVQRGETHYHCYGCGAHGDAIAFLMSHLKMRFVDAIEHLAERFQVVLERSEEVEQKGPKKAALKEALEKACQIYQFCLLHTDEGQKALHYLYARGITLDFIQKFRIGYAPKQPLFLHKMLTQQGIDEAILQAAGLFAIGETGRRRDFFSERITFPITDISQMVIGFSARKFKEETFGGKYINSPETPLFKKSQFLFGLSYSRERIAKERRALIVEGQVDALRLIYSGFDFTVAGQGTAFGEDHVSELVHLGVHRVFLALDGDEAGQKAAVKIGDLFQKKGVEVTCLALPAKSDPDSFLRERGAAAFAMLLEKGEDYLSFLVRYLGKNLNLKSPAQKNELVQTVSTQIRKWEQPVLVEESLKKLAELTRVSEEALGIGHAPVPAPYHVKKSGVLDFGDVDPDRVLETDLLRWLFKMGETEPKIVELVRANLQSHHFRVAICREVFSLYMSAENQKRDLLTLASSLQSSEQETLLAEIMQKRINLQKAEVETAATIRQILLREWMQKREEIKRKIHSGACSDEEVLALAKEFDEIKKNPPQLLNLNVGDSGD